MISYLIVDDEYPIREWLVFAIKKNFPKVIVESSDNGADALVKLQAKTYDFLITDIQMPKLNGLELLQKVRLVSPYTKVIVLSSYDNYNYVRQAFKHLALDYLLKVEITEEHLVQMILQQQNPLQNLNVRQDINTFVTKSIANENMSADEFEQGLLKRGITLPESDLFCYLIKRFRDASDEDAVIHIPSKKSTERVFSCNISDYSQCGIIHLKQRSRLMQLQERNIFISELKQYNTYALILTSDIYRVKPDILNILRHMSSCRDLDFYGIHMHAVTEHTLSWAEQFDQEYLTMLKNIKFQNWYDIKQSLLQFLKYAESVRYPDINHLKSTFEKLYEISYVYKTSKHNPDYNEKLREVSNKISNAVQFTDLQNTVLEQFQILYVDPAKNTLPSNIISCINYIENNYMQEISLNDLADFVHLNPEYLSRYFKKHTGINFSNYLTNYRLGKAAILIKETNIKIFEVSLQVGINNFAYFSKCFKEVYGCSPMEWRNQ